MVRRVAVELEGILLLRYAGICKVFRASTQYHVSCAQVKMSSENIFVGF